MMNMIKKQRTIYLRVSFITAILVLMIIVVIVASQDKDYHYRVFEQEEGYGYEILYKDKPVIYQPHVPAVEGLVPYSDRREAGKAARKLTRRLNRESKGFAFAG